MSNPSDPTVELLTEQIDWMQALARSLVRDPHEAQDLTQDTILSALRTPPRATDRRSLRSWLRLVMRSRLSESKRRRGAETERERAREDRREGDDVPPTDVLVERVEIQRRVADALLGLEEPYRTTVLLRFYEAMPPREIARRLRLPLATVKSRLHRGLDKLRSKLDAADGGDRSAWLGALAAWVGAPRPRLPILGPTGTLAVNTKFWSAAACALVVGLGSYLYWPSNTTSLERAETPELSAGENQVAMPAPSSEEALPDAALVRTARAERATASADAPRDLHTVRGTAFLADGTAASGLSIRLDAGGTASSLEPETRTDASGRFALDTEREAGRLLAADPGYVTVRPGSWNAFGSIEPVLVAARAIAVRGVVVDDWGSPVHGARIGLEIDPGFRTRFADALDSSFAEVWQTTTDENGAFAFDSLPAIDPSTLHVVHDRFEPLVVSAPHTDEAHLVLRLGTVIVPDRHAVRGVVCRPDGSPAPDALVAAGHVTVRVDQQGAFTLDRRRLDGADRLVALAPGYLPAREDLPPTAEGAAPEALVVRLPGACLTIRGRIVDAEGEPRAGGRVWVGDPRVFGTIGNFPVVVEGLASGSPLPPEVLDSRGRRIGTNDRTGSAMPAGDPSALVHWVTTDADGWFEIGGLEDRAYRLHAIDPDFGWGTISDPIPAGTTDAVLVAPGDAAWPTVRGRIVTSRGDPVPGVFVTPWVSALHLNESIGDGAEADVLRFFTRRGARSDEDGRFELTNVLKNHVQFHVMSTAIVPTYPSVEDVVDPNDFEIVVLARVHLEVESASGHDAIRVSAADGSPLDLFEIRADGYSNLREMELVDGRSGVVSITTDAHTLHLLRAGVVVDSIRIHPRPGETLRVVR
jgi:RNA polymerase sigma-70 factor (ECF subfamily)